MALSGKPTNTEFTAGLGTPLPDGFAATAVAGGTAYVVTMPNGDIGVVGAGTLKASLAEWRRREGVA